MTNRLAAELHAAVESGDWSGVGERLADDAVLDTSNEGGRQRISGSHEIVAHLSRPGPGTVTHWDLEEWDTGLALSFEWRGERGSDRRRWYLRTDGAGQVSELWSVAARPIEEDEGIPVAPPPSLLAELGASGFSPLSHSGNSGAALVRATGENGSSFVLKRVTATGADWLARVTNDRGRTAQLYAAGAFDRMPASIGHGIVAVERVDGDAWIAMRDVGNVLLKPDVRLSRDQARGILGAVAELHAEFRGAVPDGTASLAERVGMSTPGVANAERSQPDLLPKQFEQGWDAFGEVVADDVAEAVLHLTEDPGRLADALLRAQGEPTLIHGDVRGDNLGFKDGQLVLIDWDLATAGTPGAEFAWFLAHSARRIDAIHDEIEADHRQAQGEALVDAELELGMISGLVQYGWRIAHSARIHPDPAEAAWGRAELEWWVPRVRAALDSGSLAAA